MLLYIHPLNVSRSVQCLLHMGLTHVGALPPFVLDGVPGLPCRSSGLDSQSGSVSTVEGDVALGKLVTKMPFITARISRVNGCRSQDWGTSAQVGGQGNSPINVAQQAFQS